jgi:hypothetical protein
MLLRASKIADEEKKDAVKADFRYIALGTLDDPDALPPKGEFFCKDRASWMPEIRGIV